jgi:acyl carrier protein
MQADDKAAPVTPLGYEEIFTRLREILCEILILNPENVQPSSKLVDDLDADSIAFLELTWRLRSDFGLEVPQAKVDEETLTMPLLEGIAKLERAMGGTTLFEFMQHEATGDDHQNPFAVWAGLGAHAQTRDQATSMTIARMAEQLGGTVPSGFAPEASVEKLRMRDLFRFITVDSYVRYVIYLAGSQERIQAMGGADAMNREFVDKLRTRK